MRYKSTMLIGRGFDLQGKQRTASKGKGKQKVSTPCEGSTSQTALPCKGSSASGASTSARVRPEQDVVHIATLEDENPVEPTAGTRLRKR